MMGTRFHTFGREPNTRRQFFGTAAMLLAGAALSAGLHAATGHVPEPAPGLRRVWRKTAAGWERVRMFELKPGDVMRVERHPTKDGEAFETVEGVVTGEPYQIDGQWGVNVEECPPAPCH